MANPISTTMFVLLIMIMSLLLNCDAVALKVHFYNGTCPLAEKVVKAIANKRFVADPSLPAGLLRLQFHDCFVRGCDASVLIDSIPGSLSEKDAPPNLTLRGLEVIDEIKAFLEEICPGIVSCADILALATRDGVAFSGGSAYALPTGRRDGLISNFNEVDLPGPSFTIDEALAAFQTINLGLDDLVTLLGAHSVGFVHCLFFADRLYDFQGTGQPDPKMQPGMLDFLREKCPPSVLLNDDINLDVRIPMLPQSTSPFSLNTSSYKAMLRRKSVLELDQSLGFMGFSHRIAEDYVRRPWVFRRKFARAMLKLTSVNVLTGNQGEVRRNCRRVNKPVAQ